ncbi:hypothetical protein GCM10011575_38630 [Microlunatus endophyticus]|uniref:Mutator family transposase n=1 Tax=Microlunatus endophyticus TaxID=1716077 RepID=A0A917SEK5_9ACTN|nr:hypothetical protein GCM10011575_38630 [Microlunatus endophyticus]
MTTEMTPRLDPGRDTSPISGAGDDLGVMLDPVTGEPIDERELAEQLLAQAKAQGVSLVGPGGLLSSLTKQVLETALEAELTEHLGHEHGETPAGSNVRNGTRSKTVITEIGPVEIEVPRDREGSFEPQIVRKRQRRLDGIDEIVLSLTARGLTTGEVAAHFDDVYGAKVSKDTISKITDKVVAEMAEWASRPLDPIYPVIFVDAIVVKVRDGQVRNTPFYVVMGVTTAGERDILGIWPGDGGEGARFWLQVLSELKNRGVADVLIAVCDGLKGLPEAITTTWDRTIVQTSSINIAGGEMVSPVTAPSGEDLCKRVAFEALTQTRSSRWMAGRKLASGSSASSAVMRYQHGRRSVTCLEGSHRQWSHSPHQQISGTSLGSTGATAITNCASWTTTAMFSTSSKSLTTSPAWTN